MSTTDKQRPSGDGEEMTASSGGTSGGELLSGENSGTSAGSGPAWSSAEFKKRRHAFENAVENEDGAPFEFDQATRSRK